MLDWIQTNVWHTGFLVHMATLGYVLGFLFRNQIILRLLVLAATVFYIAYYYWHPSAPLWGAIFGSMLIFGSTTYGLCRLLYDRMPMSVSPELRPIFDAFNGLEPGEFRQLMKLGEHCEVSEQVTLTVEHARPSHIYFVVEGQMAGRKSGVHFNVPPGVFIGEVSFMLNALASATIELPEGGVFVRWEQAKLRAALERRPKIAQAFEALVARDMAAKIAASVRTTGMEHASGEEVRAAIH